MLPRRSFSDRFLEKVDQAAPGGCWAWTAAMDRNGYGRVGRNGKIVFAHRASWEMRHGPITDGAFVLHGCDNPACVNPDHLFLGTQAENMKDMRKKGRGRMPIGVRVYGERNGATKLSDEAVTEIRSLAGILPQRSVAARYGISPAQVCRIQTRQRRSNVAA